MMSYVNVIFLTAVLTSCFNDYKEPDLEVEEISIKDFSFEDVSFGVKALVKNNESFDIPIDAGNIQVVVGGVDAKPFSVKKFTLGGDGSKEITFAVSFKTMELLKLMGKKQLKYSVTGSVKTKKYGIEKTVKLDKKGDYKIPQKFLDQLPSFP